MTDATESWGGLGYHPWVTAAGNNADVGLELPSVFISDQQALPLIMTGMTGGESVSGVLVNQNGTVSAQLNGSARVRLAANIA